MNEMFDRIGDTNLDINSVEEGFKKKYFDDYDQLKDSKGGGVWCLQWHDNRLPTQLLVIFHILLSCSIMGCLGATVEVIIDFLSGIQIRFAALSSNVTVSFTYYFLFSVVSLFLAIIFVQLIGPNARGSGIPELKCIFSGFWFPGYFSLKTLAATFFGIIFARSSGIIIGREGPFVHISAIISFQLIRRFGLFSKLLKSEFLIRELLTTAVCVGIACSYGSVFGSIVFSIEVTTAAYQTRNYYFSFFSSLMTSVVFSFLFNGYNNRPFGTAFFPVAGICEFESHHRVSIYFLVCSVIIGVLGAFVGAFIVRSYEFLAKHMIAKFNPFVYALIVALLTSALTFNGFSGHVISYKPAHGYLRSSPALFFDCNISSLNPAELFSEDIPVHWALILFMFILMILHVLALCLSIPLGVMSPAIAIGAVLGHGVGVFFNIWSNETGTADHIPPCMMAVVGAAAVNGAVTHTFSSSFLLLELTGEYSLIFPCALGTLISVVLSKFMSDSIFTLILKLRKLPFLPNFPISVNNVLLYQVMHTDFPSIAPNITHKYLKDILTFERINLQSVGSLSFQYPILDGAGILLGTVTSRDINWLLKRRLLEPNINLYLEMQKNMSYGISFSSHLELHKLHSCFITLSLQIVFIEEKGKYCGVITRDIIAEVIEDIAKEKSESAYKFLSTAFDYTQIKEKEEKRKEKETLKRKVSQERRVRKFSQERRRSTESISFQTLLSSLGEEKMKEEMKGGGEPNNMEETKVVETKKEETNPNLTDDIEEIGAIEKLDENEENKEESRPPKDYISHYKARNSHMSWSTTKFTTSDPTLSFLEKKKDGK